MNYTFTKILKALFFVTGLFITITTQAQLPTISTLVGNSGEGFSGDGQLATAAELYLPQAATVDDSGNVYIADEYNDRIRKISITTGIINTIAGGGATIEDGVPATNSQVNTPTGVAVDDSGNVFIVDDNRIRKITKATGIINTIAGNGTWNYSGDEGPATLAELRALSIALDDTGNVYIADFQNNRVRKVSAKTGIITTVAGDGYNAPMQGGYTGDNGPATSAELDYPSGVAVDDSGDIYIADDFNYVIRKVSAKTGIITTIAGTGFGHGTFSGGYSGDGGPATSAELNTALYLVLDDSNNIYIADRGNNRIRKITAKTGIINTIAGDSVGGFAGDGGPADSAELNTPGGLALDRCGNIYFADWGNSRVRKVTITGGQLSSTAISLPATACPGKLLSFKDSSNFNATNWTWRFPGGTPDTSTNQNPFIAFNTSAIYYITVTAWNLCGNASVIAALQINSAPPLVIQPPSPQVCKGLDVKLNVPLSGSGYTWSPASTLSSSTADSVVATPTLTTTYTVTGTDSLGCLVIGSDTVTVNTGPSKPTISQSGNVLISSATQGNQWVRNDTVLTGATNQTYTITIAGYYQVIAKNPVNGCSTISDSTLYLIPTGMAQLSINSNQLSIYPNPAGGEIFININSSVADVKDWNLQITDVLGRTLYTRQSLNYTNDIDLSNLPGGMYFITVINKTGRATMPVVKQ
jgi:trimeric autotransporter adhesin